ncbi:MAG: hypothetical protein QMD17_09605 [Rhodocyclaceae bacterium]|jgi:hypothetical protein|nr:hypothetical protein [Rhodocyclaceae bacterium]
MQEKVALDKVLAWLAAEQSAASLESIDKLGIALEILGSLGLTAVQRCKILELFFLRTGQLQASLTVELSIASLPLSADLRLRAEHLATAYDLLARGFVSVVIGLSRSAPLQAPRQPADVVLLAMKSLHKQAQTLMLACSPLPAELWQHALNTLHLFQADQANPRLADEFNRMLALAVVQPESFTAHELAFLIDYLQAIPSKIHWLAPQDSLTHNAWWLDPSRDQPPCALARRRPPAHETNLFVFDCTSLANMAREHLAELASGTPPANLGLPPAATTEDSRNTLTSAANRWSGPIKRQQARRQANYRVEVCASAGALWHYLGGDGKADMEATYPLATSDWLITNESTVGFALFHVAGTCAGLRSGTALGMRLTEDNSWTVCLVRRVRSDNPAHIELGLELLAATAQAVRLAYHGTDASVPALLLPAQPALQRGETLLTMRGQFHSGPFTLLADDTAGIRLCDCTSGQLVMLTSSIEIFEFTRRTPQDLP